MSKKQKKFWYGFAIAIGAAVIKYLVDNDPFEDDDKDKDDDK